ncbi:MAG: LytTR family DNA-binding domain-containing protein [Bacteroidia bacterium]|nr:LytTR family DNA-binding domain-containing protein [Bacteroidia bacterium]
MPYSCLIVDDERPALKLLEAYINKLPHLELKAACESGLDALAVLQQEEIDLFFLDIQMPELTGLELLRSLRKRPQVILTTAYRDFAVEGFELDVTDYLLKPFSFERFMQAVNKAVGLMQPKEKAASIVPEPVSAESNEQLFLRTNYKMEKVDPLNILFVKGEREYVSVHTDERKFLINQTLNKMEDELGGDRFMRVHRSFIINMDHVHTISGNTVRIGEQEIPIGASYKKKFFERIKLL